MSATYDHSIEEEDGLEGHEGQGRCGQRKVLEPGEYFRIKFLHSSEIALCRKTDDILLAKCDIVMASGRFGIDLALVLGPVQNAEMGESEELSEVKRKATQHDLDLFDENKKKETEAFEICRDKISRLNLEMKLVSAHYLPEEPKILFFFTAESRVDFRELVKDLVGVFRTRIELRQIGVRDESRVVGGLGVCGRFFCCHSLTDKLRPVSIRMAKDQNLSLNSMKISGPCGRLLCCLAYEFDFYKEEKARLPQEGLRLEYEGARFRINEVNVVSGMIRMSCEDGRVLEIPGSRFVQNPETKTWKIVEAAIPSESSEGKDVP